MIGYLIQQELRSLLPPEHQVVTLLTMIIVDPADAAFAAPTKFVGPVYDQAEQPTRWRRRRAGHSGRTVRPGGGWCPHPSPAASSRSSRSPGSSTGGPWSSAPAAAASRRCPVLRPGRAGGRRGGDRQGPRQRDGRRGRRRGPVRHGHRRGRGLRRLGHAGAAAAGRGDAGKLSGYEFAAGSMGPKVDAAPGSSARPAGAPRSAHSPISPGSSRATPAPASWRRPRHAPARQLPAVGPPQPAGDIPY